MKYSPKNFYNYFRECYQLDYKEFEVDNILGRKHTHKWFVSKTEELLSRKLPIIPYFNKKIVELEKEIELYKLEKKLFYGCFFLLGKKENSFSKDKRVCAPLFLFPAKIQIHEDERFLEINKSDLIINRSVLIQLELKNSSLSKDQFIKEVSELLFNDKNEMIGLKRILDKFFLNVNTDELLLFPSVWSALKIRKHLAETAYEDGEFKIVPAAGSVFIKKSESSLRVLNDLEEMAKKAKFNTVIEKLINPIDTLEAEFDFSFYKSRLNTDQFKALKNAYTCTNSVIVGPPGTGKTYTITSIVSDAVINGLSVLIVSKTKQAVEVLRKMLQDDFKLKDYLIHTTGINYKVSLKSKIRKYLSGITARQNLLLNEEVIKNLYTKLEELEEGFEEFVERELEVMNLEFANELSFFDKWRKFYLKFRLSNGEKLWILFSEIEAILHSLEKEISIFSKRKIQSNIRNNFKVFRKDISLFFDALDSSSFTEYKRLLDSVEHKNILKIFPIWLANLSELNSVLPLQEDLFDLVIIDEATQCDMASALPALYRARKAIIVGDPNQLRHYSFVSRDQQLGLRKEYQLPEEKIFDYRNRSVLDVFISKASHQSQITFLREHFRSTPSLIEFSNQQFYDGQLEILKSSPKHTSHNQIEIINIEGKRNEKGVNEIEARAVINKLSDIIKKYKDEIKVPTIGIISPFSKQVVFINKLLKEKYTLEVLKRFNLLCGSPYHFQGSERDIILLSFSVCNYSHPSTFIHINKPEVLNVTITRAKSYQIIFKSVSETKLNQESLLYQYFKFAKEFSHVEVENSDQDQFQNEVYKELLKLNYDNIQCGYPIAGSILDILVTQDDDNYFIDLIGYPGMFKEAFTFERYKTLARIGVKTFPLHYTYWKKDKSDAINKIKKRIKSSI